MPAPGIREKAEAAFGLLDKLLLLVANLSLVLIVGVICWSVWTRYVLRTPVVWGDDVTSLAFAWFIFIGMAAVHNRRGHVSIDIATNMLPARAQAALEKFADIVVAAFCGYTALICARQTTVAHTLSQTPVLDIPLSYFFASLTIGFALMAIRSVGFLFGVRPIPVHETMHQ